MNHAACCTCHGVGLVAREAGLDCCGWLGDVTGWWGNVVKESTAALCCLDALWSRGLGHDTYVLVAAAPWCS